VSVCTLPGGVTLRRAVEIDPEAASLRGLWMDLGVRNSAGCSVGSVNSKGGNSFAIAASSSLQPLCWLPNTYFC